MVDSVAASGLLEPRGPKQLASVPEPRFSADAIVRPYTLVAAAVGHLGDELGAAAERVGVQAATEAGQAAVTRDDQGNITFEPRPFAFDKAGEAYNAAGRQSALSQSQSQTRSAVTVAHAEYQNDPVGFQSWFKGYSAQVGKGLDPNLRTVMKTYADELGGQHLANLQANKVKSDAANAQAGLEAQVAERRSSLMALARAPEGVGSEEWTRTYGQLQDLYGTLAGNPLYNYPRDRADRELAHVSSLAVGESVVGEVDRNFDKRGRAEAEKYLRSKVLENADPNLTEQDRTRLFNTGLARLSYLSGEQKAAIAAERQTATTLISDLRVPGSGISDDQVNSQLDRLRKLGDADTALRLEAAKRVAGEGSTTAAGAGLSDEQRVKLWSGRGAPPATGDDGSRVFIRMLNRENAAGDPAAVSPKGAMGLAQVMPDTAREVAASMGRKDVAAMSDDDLRAAFTKDPDLNLRIGRRYFDSMVDRYHGDREAAVIAYNAGPSRADSWLKRGRDDAVLPDETRAYRDATVGGTGEVTPVVRQNSPIGSVGFDGSRATVNGKSFTDATSPEAVARQFEGVGEKTHRDVLAAFMSKACGRSVDPANIPWCAGFADAVLAASGRATRGSLRAADFLSYGTATDSPSKGDVVVFKSLAAGSSGHVGFVVGIEGDKVRYIAGNDSNKVQESTLSVDKVAGFRHPPEPGDAPIPLGDARRAAAPRLLPGQIPYSDEEVKRNPYLRSEAVRSAIRDQDAQVDLANRLVPAMIQGLKKDALPNPDTLASVFQIVGSNPDKLAGRRDELMSALEGYHQGQAILADGDHQGASELVVDALKRAQGGSIYGRMIADHFQETVERGRRNLSDDPGGEAARRKWIPRAPAPMDLSTPDTIARGLAEHGAAAFAISSRTGNPDQGAFGPRELDQVKTAANSGSMEQRMALLAGLAQLPEGIRNATLGQLGKQADTAVLALAGGLAPTAPDVARSIVAGQAAMQADERFVPSKGPQKEAFAREKDTGLPVAAFPPAIRMDPAGPLAAMGSAIDARYAFLAAQAGDTSGSVNTARLRQATNDVTGGVLRQNGAPVIAPTRGMSQREFDGVMTGLSDGDLQGVTTGNGRPITADYVRGSAKLHAVGDGSYLVQLNGNDSAPLYASKGGRAFVLSLKGRQPAAPVRTPRTDDYSLGMGVP